MKRILSIILLCIVTLFLMSCEAKDEELVFRDQTYEDLAAVFDYFGPAQYEDLEYEDETMSIEGMANLIMNDIDNYEINQAVFEDGISVLLTVYLGEDTTRQSMIFKEVWITYIDHNQKLYIDLEFYKNNILNISETKSIDRNYLDFIRGLRRFTVKDYQEMLYELGYREVKNET